MKALEWRKDYYYDKDAAYNAIEFFQNEIYHIKGPLAGQTLKLEKWQRRIIRRIYGWKKKSDNTRKHRTVFIFIPRKNGKALCINTPILTSKGFKLMKDININDYVVHPSGRHIKVLGVSEVMQDRECFDILFNDRNDIRADGDHLWTSNTGETLTTKQIWQKQNEGKFKFELPNISPTIEIDNKEEVPIDPYYLGLYFARVVAGNIITTKNRDVISKLEARGFKFRYVPFGTHGLFKLIPTGSLGWGKSAMPYLLALQLAGVLERDRIPDYILNGSYEVRKDFICGYVDSLGCNDTCRLTMLVKNENYVEDIHYLLKSVGAKKVAIRYVDCFKQGQNFYYQFFFYLDLPELLHKKAENYRNDIKNSVFIKQIKKCESVPVKCIEVDSPDGLYLCGKGLYPTHNSFMGAGIGLLGLYADGIDHYVEQEDGTYEKMFFPELGAEVYSAAVDKSQAKVIFDVASQMIAYNERLQSFEGDRYTEKTKNEIRYNELRNGEVIELAKYAALSADAESKHGSNPSTVVFDELHTQPNGNLVEALKTGIVARSQPLQVYFTTAGNDKGSICYEYYTHAKEVLSGKRDDPSFYPVIYEAGPDDDWKDEATWYKANPNLGISIPLETFREAYRDALKNGREENSFKRLHLNIWTETLDRWLDMYQWRLCGDKSFDPEILKGCPCVAGIDLSRKFDITALVLLFSGRDIPKATDDDVYVLPFFWLPSEQVEKKEKGTGDRVSYTNWIKKGLVRTTKGPIVDFKRILSDILELKTEYKIKEICYDPYMATDLATDLANKNMKVIEVNQTIAKLSAPSKELEALLESTTLRHNNNEVLAWMAKNAAVTEDGKGNIAPHKGHSTGRIDGITAMVTGLSRLMKLRNKKSKYETEGL